MVHALLTDGTTVRIRRVRPADHDAVLALYEEMSPENLRLRFFAASHLSAEQAADRACARRTAGYRALLAEAQGGSSASPSTTRRDRNGDRPRSRTRASPTDWHHRGLGTLLLEHLVDAARAGGHHRLHGRRAGREPRDAAGLRRPRPAYVPPLRWSRSALHRRTRRGRGPTCPRSSNRASTADVASLKPLLRPRAVAVVGAGRKPGSVGRAVLRNLRTGGFTGRLYAVNPHADVDRVGELPPLRGRAVLPAPTSPCSPSPPPPSRQAAEECGKAGVGRCWWSPPASTPTGGRRCSPRAARTGCGWSAPTAWSRQHRPGLRLNATFAADHPLPRHGRGRRAVRRRRHRAARRAVPARHRRLHLRLARRQVRRQRQRHAPVVGERRPHRPRRAAPGILRQPARLLANGPARGPHDAGAYRGRRALRGRSPRRRLAHRGRGHPDHDPPGPVHPGRNHRDPHDRRTAGQPQRCCTPSRCRPAPRSRSSPTRAAQAYWPPTPARRPGWPFPRSAPSWSTSCSPCCPRAPRAANPVDATAAVTEDAAAGVRGPALGARGRRRRTGGAGPHRGRRGDRRRSRPGASPRPGPPSLPDGRRGPARTRPRGSSCCPPRAADSYPPTPNRGRGAAPWRTPPTCARWRARPEGTVPDLAGVDTTAAKASPTPSSPNTPTGLARPPCDCAELLGHYGIPQIRWEWADDEEAAVAAAARLRRT